VARRLFVLAAFLVLAGFLTAGQWTWHSAPAAEAAQAGGYPQHVLLIRHAEKPAGKGDPHLTSRGAARAAALPSLFFIPKSAFQTKPAPFPTPDFIYATKKSDNSNRPVETVEPLAKALGMEIHHQHANQDFPALVDHLFNDKHAGKTVLICWHHGTIAELTLTVLKKAKNSKKVTSDVPKHWKDDVFDRVWQIDFDKQGNATYLDRPQKLLFKDQEK
jgi:broad specificity phosphatase PhoE